METVQRILDLIDRHNITAAQLQRDTKLSPSLITQWKKGLFSPSYGALVKIADYFNVSVEYLEGKTDDPKPSIPSPKLTVEEVINIFWESGMANEAELLKAFSKLNGKEQERVLGYAQARLHGLTELAEGRSLQTTRPRKSKQNIVQDIEGK